MAGYFIQPDVQYQESEYKMSKRCKKQKQKQNKTKQKISRKENFLYHEPFRSILSKLKGICNYTYTRIQVYKYICIMFKFPPNPVSHPIPPSTNSPRQPKVIQISKHIRLICHLRRLCHLSCVDIRPVLLFSSNSGKHER